MSSWLAKLKERNAEVSRLKKENAYLARLLCKKRDTEIALLQKRNERLTKLLHVLTEEDIEAENFEAEHQEAKVIEVEDSEVEDSEAEDPETEDLETEDPGTEDPETEDPETDTEGMAQEDDPKAYEMEECTSETEASDSEDGELEAAKIGHPLPFLTIKAQGVANVPALTREARGAANDYTKVIVDAFKRAMSKPEPHFKLPVIEELTAEEHRQTVVKLLINLRRRQGYLSGNGEYIIDRHIIHLHYERYRSFTSTKAPLNNITKALGESRNTIICWLRECKRASALVSTAGTYVINISKPLLPLQVLRGARNLEISLALEEIKNILEASSDSLD
ncbi:hypothetical protein BC936DRAFT_140830 [Jimgerdemannia flammicorona]|uniref:Uncharacterized protein n=1 Tax=Jimgerdemannia flammicorona TaxID=994334 RepID=A0A433DGQ9_9FUNG|nr:hypothetical protein BC936DRAFT_140830 [Jimgerdemannia flammicorona]